MINIFSFSPIHVPQYQSQINSNHLRRAEQEITNLQGKVQHLSAQNKGLLAQLTESKRKQAEIECKVRAMDKWMQKSVHLENREY